MRVLLSLHCGSYTPLGCVGSVLLLFLSLFMVPGIRLRLPVVTVSSLAACKPCFIRTMAACCTSPQHIPNTAGATYDMNNLIVTRESIEF